MIHAWSTGPCRCSEAAVGSFPEGSRQPGCRGQFKFLLLSVHQATLQELFLGSSQAAHSMLHVACTRRGEKRWFHGERPDFIGV